MRTLMVCLTVLLATPSLVNAQVEVEVERTNDRAIALGKKIRCPVCQGTPIAESPSQSAQDMMKQLRRLVAEGKTDAEIIEWFKQRYGEWAILEPSREGFNLVVWLLPIVVLAGGVAFWRMNIGGGEKPAMANGSEESADEPSNEDPYLKALRDEVEA